MVKGDWGFGAWQLAGRWLGAARGHGGRHESGGVSCCCCWLAEAGELGLGVDGVLELLGPAVTGTRESGSARERGSEGREDEKEFEFGRPEHNQCTIAAEEREGGARDKSGQVKKDKTSRGRDY
ncbi:hypothetical protein F5882DRAFT_386803 [Hyaloscypha sp. PMI_1271]|nr:hypothetical protein F5882DRAFT_386803 [Hyaloscypha sp. PMI_1271]